MIDVSKLCVCGCFCKERDCVVQCVRVAGFDNEYSKCSKV